MSEGIKGWRRSNKLSVGNDLEVYTQACPRGYNCYTRICLSGRIFISDSSGVIPKDEIQVICFISGNNPVTRFNSKEVRKFQELASVIVSESFYRNGNAGYEPCATPYVEALTELFRGNK